MSYRTGSVLAPREGPVEIGHGEGELISRGGPHRSHPETRATSVFFGAAAVGAKSRSHRVERLQLEGVGVLFRVIPYAGRYDISSWAQCIGTCPGANRVAGSGAEGEVSRAS